MTWLQLLWILSSPIAGGGLIIFFLLLFIFNYFGIENNDIRCSLCVLMFGIYTIIWFIIHEDVKKIKVV